MTDMTGDRADGFGTSAAWAVSAGTVAAQFGADPATGLTAVEAARRLALDGPNELDAVASKPAWRLFLNQFANTMIIVLLVALAITAVVGDIKDALVIAAVVLLNAVVGFVQEHRAERAAGGLAAHDVAAGPGPPRRRDGPRAIR